MSITEEVKGLVELASEICKERNLDLKDLMEKENYEEFNSVWNEAINIFFKTDTKEIDVSTCSKCKAYDDKVEKIKDLIEQKKHEKKFESEEIQSGVITGLEMALAILL